MLALAKLVWWPHIHSEIVAKAKACRHCIDKGEILKPIIPKNQLGDLPKLNEPNEEIQMDFAGPIPYKNSTQNNYILVTVDRLSRFPHAETFHNCETETAIDYLEKYCKLHGIPRSIRCDQAQAFKAKEFDIFCKNKNIKLILAPAGDHRATGMVERLIQTIKRRLAVLDIDPNWSSETLSSRLANIIENIRLIPNRTTKITPFEAHFGRKPNTALSNKLTKPSIKNLSYHKLKSCCLDKRTLKHDVSSQEEMWRLDGKSEDELDIQYKQDENPTSTSQQIDSDDSENLPLSRSSPSKISPSIGDKTTKIIYNKKNFARKSIARKTKEPRNTLAPQWTIIPDGTITNYTPHTITIDTPLRKNTVIQKNDIAIASETKPIPKKPRLIHMDACKTVGEYKRNQEKIRKFCLDEAKKQITANKPLGTKRTHDAINSTMDPLEPSSSTANINETTGTTKAKTRNKRSINTPGPSRKSTSNKDIIKQIKKNNSNTRTIWSRDKLIQIATKNQRQQQQYTTSKTPKGVSKAKTKHSTPIVNFNERAKQAAILNSKETNSIRRSPPPMSDTDTSSRSFLIFNTPVSQPKSIKIYNVEADRHDERSYEVITSNDAQDFMEMSPLSPKTQNKQSITATTTLDNEAINDTKTNTPDMTFAISTKKIDIATEKIYAFNAKKQDNIIPSTKKDNQCQEQPQIIFLDSSTSSNQTIDLTNNSSDPTPHGTTDTSQSNQCQPEQNTIDYTRNKTESTQEADIEQLQVEKSSQLQMELNTLTTQINNKEATKETTPEQLQVEKVSSPASSLIYKTPPSSPNPDSISDLSEEDLAALNEIP